ncbi:hypothetical protein HOU08_gp112 [Dickeya phage vB_DsoM_JA29]|uniref:Uncharacterized protein n=1 Tax=Dickeya phage vB_DsoM_JA29 TaxID=2283031 RepID=A0A384ZX60_9CAUD|nr:hypothetical protein HOU08_gp112 [Dickeya phage vB_DsoM_JA29]AXG66838.1 hypothetical protein JA29_112 [Dickeya phage vB_DsoM_JA29]
MKTFPEVFGSNTFAAQIEPSSLAIMIAAAGFNLTGARNIIEDAHQYNDSRAAIIARSFADCAQFVQRCYRRNPHARIEILSTVPEGAPCSAIVVSQSGEVLFDPKQSSFAYCLGNYKYGYNVGDAIVEYVVVGSSTLRSAVDALSKAGFWVDRAWNWDEPKPRANDYL